MENIDKNNLDISLNVLGIDLYFVLQESFLGYKYRKQDGKLYDRDKEIPTNLIKLYYTLGLQFDKFDTLKKEGGVC